MYAADWAGYDQQRAVILQGVRAGALARPFMFQAMRTMPPTCKPAPAYMPATSILPRRAAYPGHAQSGKIRLAISPVNSAIAPPPSDGRAV
jgi:hypothetical protein